jgi:hypothetical protein
MSINEIIDKYLLSEERKWKKSDNEYVLQDKNTSGTVVIKQRGKDWVIYVNGKPKSKSPSLPDAKDDAELYIHEI